MYVKAPEKTTLQVILDGGIKDGKQVRVPRTISRLKLDATDENLYVVASAIFSLQEMFILDTLRIDTAKIVEQ